MTFYKKGYHVVRNLITEDEAFLIHDHLKKRDDGDLNDLQIMNLGGDEWAIWLLDRDENPVKVNLNSGDALIYRGCEIKHWRGKFKHDTHAQVFMHYVDKYGSCAWAKDDIKQQP